MTAPELSPREAAIVDRFDRADPAPESCTERAAAAMYEATTDRLWIEAGDLDRDSYLVEAQAVIDVLRGERPEESLAESSVRKNHTEGSAR